jgi:thioredoxin 1
MSSDPELDRILKKKMEEFRQKNKQEIGIRQNSGPVILSDENFEMFVAENRVAVIDFWAPWCGPCRIVSPIIEELSRNYSGKIAFGKLNVDENPLTSARYGIQSIPTIIIFLDGKIEDKIIGAVPKYVIESRIRPYAD